MLSRKEPHYAICAIFNVSPRFLSIFDKKHVSVQPVIASVSEAIQLFKI